MSTTPKRVLVCDDEPAVTRLIALYLGFDGFEVETLNDSREVVPTLLKSNFDLVFLDLIMPELTGEKVVALAREEPSLKTLPVIVLTAKTLKASERGFLRRYGASVLSKPFQIHELVQRARQAMPLESAPRKQHG